MVGAAWPVILIGPIVSDTPLQITEWKLKVGDILRLPCVAEGASLGAENRREGPRSACHIETDREAGGQPRGLIEVRSVP